MRSDSGFRVRGFGVRGLYGLGFGVWGSVEYPKQVADSDNKFCCRKGPTRCTTTSRANPKP